MNTDDLSQSTSTVNNSIHEDLEVLFEESAALANRLKKNARLLHKNDNLSASGRGLLQTLQLHGPMTVPQLAASRSTSRQNIQVLTDRLQEAGFVEFTANPGHKRSVLTALTKAGRAILSSANDREAALLGNLLPHAASAQLREATELLRKLRFQLGGAPKRRKSKTRTAVSPECAAVDVPAPVAEDEDDSLPVNLL